jgi:transposase
MDNVAFHQISGVEEAIEKMGATLIYLPPYSPDLNPIELMWSKIKGYLRITSARDLKKFKTAIKIAYENIEQTDLNNWFSHCGYQCQ